MVPDRVTRPEKFSATFLRTMLCITAIVSLLSSCNKKDKWIDVDPAFSQFIDAYTTGIVSKTSAIRIQLASEASTTHAVGEAVNEGLFEFSPSIKGKAFWLDARTIEFKPEGWIKANQQYTVSFKLGKVTKVPEKYSTFRFSMQTVNPSFKISDNGLRSSGVKNKMSFSGEIETADIEKGAETEKLLTATQNNKDLKITWTHNDAAKTHSYSIDNIERGSSAGIIKINWNGKPMEMDIKGEKEIAIPALGDFKVLEVMAVNDAQQYASVQFSDPIAVGQDLEG